MSSAIPTEPQPPEKGLVWAKHGGEEVGYWHDFLPGLCRLWSAVKDPEINPYFSFKVIREDSSLRYQAKQAG